MNQNQGSSAPADQKILWGILAYLGPLVIISYIVGKDNPFVKFHIKQGLVLVVIELILWFAGMIMPLLWMILQLANLVVFVLAIIGIINVTQKKEKILPFVGQFAKNFNF